MSPQPAKCRISKPLVALTWPRQRTVRSEIPVRDDVIVGHSGAAEGCAHIPVRLGIVLERASLDLCPPDLGGKVSMPDVCAAKAEYLTEVVHGEIWRKLHIPNKEICMPTGLKIFSRNSHQHWKISNSSVDKSEASFSLFARAEDLTPGRIRLRINAVRKSSRRIRRR